MSDFRRICSDLFTKISTINSLPFSYFKIICTATLNLYISRPQLIGHQIYHRSSLCFTKIKGEKGMEAKHKTKYGKTK